MRCIVSVDQQGTEEVDGIAACRQLQSFRESRGTEKVGGIATGWQQKSFRDQRGTEEVGGIAAVWLSESFHEQRLARACERSDGRRELGRCRSSGDSRGKENVAEMRWWTEMLHAWWVWLQKSGSGSRSWTWRGLPLKLRKGGEGDEMELGGEEWGMVKFIYTHTVRIGDAARSGRW
ncbi:hypothetical protein SLEP1_g6863 [Rubroshorea leprosula]|uniref:Uncharacterized protein n=1 Tax=Rubroshorea leprosula TaxID=152421 RepID=A0AAV5I4V1_9ROSI|nr:hypothetical protein SLEP1_g6863 [Rubroshorea leprosula]